MRVADQASQRERTLADWDSSVSSVLAAWGVDSLAAVSAAADRIKGCGWSLEYDGGCWQGGPSYPVRS